MSELLIETLNLRLPSGFEGRADAIARETAQQLARLAMDQSVQMDAVTVPTVRLQGGETNGVIARRIAQSIHARVSAPGSSGGVSRGGAHD